MPFGDRTGPLGFGPGTGRRAGYCGGFGMLRYTNPVPGGRFGFGGASGRGRGWFGRGRGWRNRYWTTGLPGWARGGYGYPPVGAMVYPYGPDLSEEEEMNLLKNQARLLRKELDEIEGRISTLEKARGQEEQG
ncbi:MAG: DUF5320 domain-containing protein [Nitrospirota bacterium]